MVPSMYYHILLINLFEPFTQMGYVHAEANPSTIVSHSKACLETLMRIYYLRHGFESLDNTLVHPLHLLGFSALRDISSVEKGSSTYEAIRSTLVLCAKGLWEQGRNHYVAEVVFRLFKHCLSIDDVLLVEEIIEVEESDSRLGHMVQEIRSLWPIGIFSMADEGGDRTLNHFIRWWDQHMQDRAQDSTPEQDLTSTTLPTYPQR